MAPPKAKIRKRKNASKKKDDGNDSEEVIDMFGLADSNGQSDFDIPMPPMMSKQVQKEKEAAARKKKDDDDDSDDDDALPAKSKYNKRTNDIKLAQAGGDKGIKVVPLVLLFILCGSTLIPLMLAVGDSVSGFLAKSDIMGSIGYRLGIGAVPRKRVISFYEKHNPEKLPEVPKLLAKHYGDYPKLTKKLERKYNDYGYFMGWEEDEAPMRIVQEQLGEAYSVWIQQYWNKYAPVFLRTRVRNVKYNLTAAYKQGRKLWRKHVWPLLEPVFGVPDERAAAKQKRKDAKMAQDMAREARASTSSGGTRRKNTDFRDSDEED